MPGGFDSHRPPPFLGSAACVFSTLAGSRRRLRTGVRGPSSLTTSDENPRRILPKNSAGFFGAETEVLPWCACFGGKLAGGGGGCTGVGLADCLVSVGTLEQVDLQ